MREGFTAGEAVTVQAVDGDPVVLQLHPHVIVVKPEGDGYLVRPASGGALAQVFGPIPASRLERGWKDEAGRWRRP